MSIKRKLLLAISLSLVVLFVSNVQAAGNTYYVSPSGLDSNSGTDDKPFKTIQRAADIVNPGDTVIVKDGIYNISGKDGYIALLTRSGSSDGYITFKSQNKNGAILDGNNNSIQHGLAIVNASYIKIKSFEIRNLSAAGMIIDSDSNHIEIRDNHIHHIGKVCSDSEYGNVGAYLNKVSNIIFEKNVFNDIGRFAEGENGCKNSNNNYKNHDHGLYLDAVNNVLITDNVFYNIHAGLGVHIYSGNGLSSSGINVINNTFAFGHDYYEAGHLIIASDLSDSVIANNIFYSQEGWGMNVYPDLKYKNVVVENNITYLGKGKISPELNIDGINFTGNLDNTDPKFINPSQYNFALSLNSPAIDAGISWGGIKNDFNNTRLQGKTYDIGAFEFSQPVIALSIINLGLTRRLAGRILLQTEQNGEAWYIDPVSLKRYYLADAQSAYEALRKFGLGIKNIDLVKIPIGAEPRSRQNIPDAITSNPLAIRLRGRIVIQVESHGEAWYINPADGKRYYLANGEAAYRIMSFLSLGVSNDNIQKIPIGNW